MNNLEPWQESFVLYMYTTQQRFYTSFEDYQKLIQHDFFKSSLAIAYKAAYSAGYIHGQADAAKCTWGEF